MALLLSGSTAWSQAPDTGFELERLELNTGQGSLLAGSGELLVPTAWNLGLISHYQLQPFVLRNGESQLIRVQQRASLVLAGSYGVLPWLEVGAQLPAVLWQRGEDLSHMALPPVKARGLGTPVLQARLGLLSQRQEQPMDLSVDLGVGLPVGSGPALARDPALRAHARVAVGWRWGWLRPAFDAGVLLRPSQPLFTNGPPQLTQELRLGAGVSMARKGFRGELTVRGAFARDSGQPALEALAGVRVPLASGWELLALAGPGLGTAPGTPAARVLLGLTFGSEPPPRLERLAEAIPTLRLEQAPLAAPADEVPLTVEPVPTRELLPAEPSPVNTAPLLQGSVLFEPGQAELSGDLGPLQAVAQHLSALPGAPVIQLEGHAGLEEEERKDPLLPLRRAQAVARFLASQGVSLEHMRVRIAGTAPAGSPATLDAHARARRVEVRVSSRSAPVAGQTP